MEWKNNVTDNWTTTLVFPVNSIVTDKNHLWVDNSILSPVERRYNLYCGWSHGFATGTPTIRMARSLDGGETWEPQVPIIHTDSDDMFHGGVNIQTGRTGRVYAMWSIRRIPNPDPITVSFGFSESNDGGVTFSNQKILLANGVHDVAGNPVRGAQTWPSMTVDRSNPAGDSLYVVWADITPINGRDILMMKGFADADLSPVVWDESTIITVNQDVGNNKQWWPWITWDECTGMLAVVFMDSRVVEGQSKARTFVAVTADGGSSWTETRVSEGAGDPDAVGYDYIGIAAGDGRVFPVWSDDRTGAGDFRPYTSPLLLWGIEQPSVNDAVITNINGTISVVAWWSTNINSDDSVQIQLTSPTDQVYGCDPSTNCNTSMGGGTNHALILDVPCELGTWKYTVTSTRNGCIQPRTSDEKTFKILNCLN